jgi:uncharacterized membrane protein YkoI
MAALLLLTAQQGFSQLAPGVQPGQLDNAVTPRDVRQAETPAPQISERQAVALAQQRFPGNVLRISLVGQGNNLRYQIRMENEGKIFTVFVNAATGAVSGG